MGGMSSLLGLVALIETDYIHGSLFLVAGIALLYVSFQLDLIAHTK